MDTDTQSIVSVPECLAIHFPEKEAAENQR
jgi:hypothetical protein